MEKMFFDNTDALLRTLIIGILAYITLIVFLRISGKRTLSKLNAFDLVVTVALGSTLSSILISKNVSLAQGALGFALLIGMQFLVTWSSVRVKWVRQIVTGEPTMLLYQGEYLPTALRKMRVTRDEVVAAIRSTGIAAVDEVEAVVLETDGSLSVIAQSAEQGKSSLQGVYSPGIKPSLPEKV